MSPLPRRSPRRATPAEDAKPDEPRAAEARERRLAAIGSTASAVAHDLRNLLTPILGGSRRALGVALERKLDIAEDLRLVVRSAERIHRMAEDILLIASGEPQPMDVRAHALGPLLMWCLDGIAQDLATAGIELIARMDGCDRLAVLADREAFHRVMLNLLRNAREAIEARACGERVHPPGKVGIEARSNGPWLSLWVTDNGRGLGPEARERLFAPFGTAGKPGGVGLGLFVARELARRQGGDLSAEPTPPDSGAAFCLSLRIAARPEPERF